MTRMSDDFPDDENGDVLRRMQNDVTTSRSLGMLTSVSFFQAKVPLKSLRITSDEVVSGWPSKSATVNENCLGM